jgi:serine/threonine protein kinase
MSAGPTFLNDRYELGRRMGSGAHGTVWRAHDHFLDREVAIKECRVPNPTPAQFDEFRKEGRALARVDSAYVVEVHDFLRTDEGLYLVMELVNGESLEAHLKRGPRPALPTVARWITEICAGLAAAHRVNIIHRDMKPGNIMITPVDEHVKIVDFGLAAFMELTTSNPPNVMLTPAYAAPERWLRRRGDARSDLYSLGCILYELLTGRTPFHEHSTERVHFSWAHLDETVPEPSRLVSGLPADLDRLTLELLEKDPARRPADVLIVAERIQRAVRAHLPHAGDAAELSFLSIVEQNARGSSRDLGPTHPDALERLREQAHYTAEIGDHPGAARLYRQLAGECEQAYGPSDPRAMDAWAAMSRCFRLAAGARSTPPSG